MTIYFKNDKSLTTKLVIAKGYNLTQENKHYYIF